jgi:excisionase family DNA binding protein
MDTPRLWCVSEAAAFLGSSKVSLYRALEAGTMPGYKVPRIGWRLDPNELKAWLESQKNTTRPR